MVEPPQGPTNEGGHHSLLQYKNQYCLNNGQLELPWCLSVYPPLPQDTQVPCPDSPRLQEVSNHFRTFIVSRR